MPAGATSASRRTAPVIACSISARVHATRARAPGGVTPSWRIWLRARLSSLKSTATRCVHAGSEPSSSTSQSLCFLPEDVPASASIAVAKSTSASAGRARSAPAWKYLRAATTIRCGALSDATTSATSRSTPMSIVGRSAGPRGLPTPCRAGPRSARPSGRRTAVRPLRRAPGSALPNGRTRSR